MRIEYILADGQKISYEVDGIITHSDICNLAEMYAKARPTDLPTHVFMHVRVYTDFVKTIHGVFMGAGIEANGPTLLQIHTGCGVLFIKPMPYAFDKFIMMVGKQEDYDRYFLDEVFEETVLKDCESA